jgi:hypothetical protein
MLEIILGMASRSISLFISDVLKFMLLSCLTGRFYVEADSFPGFCGGGAAAWRRIGDPNRMKATSSAAAVCE